MPRLSNVTQMGLEQIVGEWAKAGLGLGRCLQRMKKAITMMPKEYRYGLGHKPIGHERKNNWKKKRERRMDGLEDHRTNEKPMVFFQLYETF